MGGTLEPAVRRPGEVVRAARLGNGLTLAELGNRTGYSAAQVSRYERGVTPLRDVSVLRRFARALAISPGELGLAGTGPGGGSGRALIAVASGVPSRVVPSRRLLKILAGSGAVSPVCGHVSGMQGERPGELAGPDVWETCRELIPAGSVFAFLAVHREALFPAGMFADMYPSPNGRPSMPPQVLAVTVVLQALYGLADHDAVQALRCDLRWKAACGLGLLDPGFHPSLLTYFRRRLARSGDPGPLFSTVKEVVAATGALAGKHRRALDSTVLDDAVATQDTVTQLVAAIRRVIREVPGAAAAAAAVCGAHDYRDPGKPKIAWDDEQARAALVSALVNDALGLLGLLPAQPEGPAADAAGLLALVAGQDVEPAAGWTGPTGGGGSPAGPRRTAWSRSPTRTRGTSTRTAPATRTGSRRTWPSSPRRACSPQSS